MPATLELAQQLIARASLTPEDAGCQDLLAARLRAVGFVCETLISGPAQHRVTNLWAKREAKAPASPLGHTELLVFAGHTDVVPTGPLEQWHSDPFTPTQRDGNLYGRGAADMKTSVAAFVVAVEEFIATQADTPLAIAVLLTSDEEGPAIDGTLKVCHLLQQRGERLDYCIVGEPTALERSGDTIKNGRRGSLSARLLVRGKQGHIAYPHLAKNPILLAAPALAELAAVHWDSGNSFFPPTSWQVSNIHGGAGAENVIPGHVTIDFNFRFSTQSTPEQLQTRLCAVLERHGLDYELVWTLGGEPYFTAPGTLVEVLRAAIQQETGLQTTLSTGGGTSDGRYIAKICPQVVELGPPGGASHQIDEHLRLADIEPLKNIYRRVLEELHTRLQS